MSTIHDFRAIDDAARYFQDACDRGLAPDDFVEEMKKKGIRVPGIGHRIKSKVADLLKILPVCQASLLREEGPVRVSQKL